MTSRLRLCCGIFAFLAVAGISSVGHAQAPAAAPTLQDLIAKAADNSIIANTVWTLIAGMLVFWMNAGFATLEAGLCRRKNAVNILAKNFIVFAVSSIAFWAIGFGLMFNTANKFVGTSGFFNDLQGDGSTFDALSWAKVPLTCKFFFQLVFAGTAATIVSGAVAERIKFGSFMIFSFLLVALVYPVTGHWVWGAGWLADRLYHDFAGSSVVHMCGGAAALAGILILGPRLGKYNPDGSVNPIQGHNLGLASLGCLILWLGWFGFNPGSTMTATGFIGHIAVTTNTAAAFGAVAATITAWLVLGKPDLTMILNGCLAGLVAITAPCASVSVAAAAFIGAVAGVLVVLSVVFWDRVKIDDPVGVLSVHLVNGIWGVLAVGLFAKPEILKQWVNADAEYCKAGLFNGGGWAQLTTQFIGTFAIGGSVFIVSIILWIILKATVGIRVSKAEEMEGLDIGEHGMEAYAGFASTTEPAFAAHEIPTSAEFDKASHAVAPPNGHKRFSIVVEGANNDKLIDAWSDLCQTGAAPPSAEFSAVYPYLTTVQGNRFRFRGGDPENLRQNLETLFRGTLKDQAIKSRVENN